MLQLRKYKTNSPPKAVEGESKYNRVVTKSVVCLRIVGPAADVTAKQLQRRSRARRGAFFMMESEHGRKLSGREAHA